MESSDHCDEHWCDDGDGELNYDDSMDDVLELLLLQRLPSVQCVQDEELGEVLLQLQLSEDDVQDVQGEGILVLLTCIVKRKNGDLQQQQRGDSVRYDVQCGDLQHGDH